MNVGAVVTRLLTVVPAAMPVPPTNWPTEKLAGATGRKRLPVTDAPAAVRPVFATSVKVPVPDLVSA